MIRLKNLSKYFGSVKALDGVSFEVGRGEVVGFLGPNGAGKTTTMRLICGYLKPTEGKIRVGEIDPSVNRVGAASMIGYLPENNPLYSDMKVNEYLHFIKKLKIKNEKLKSTIQKSKFKDKKILNSKSEILNKSKILNLKSQTNEYTLQKTAEVCGLEEKLNTKIDELSRGYKQRVGLAAALLGDPQILILDEPTSGLDPNQVIQIRELIKEMGKKKTVILSTHVLQEVEEMCSRVIIIDKGRIVWDGKTPKRKGRLEKIFREATIGYE